MMSEKGLKNHKAETAKKYLDKLRVLDAKIRYKKEELAEVKSTLGQSARGFSERVQTSVSVDAICQEVIRLLYIEDELTDCIGEFLKQKEGIVREIFSLENQAFIDVLTQRYVFFKYFDEIERKMNYSYRHIKRLHKKALIAFYDKVLIKKETERD